MDSDREAPPPWPSCGDPYCWRPEHGGSEDLAVNEAWFRQMRDAGALDWANDLDRLAGD